MYDKCAFKNECQSNIDVSGGSGQSPVLLFISHCSIILTCIGSLTVEEQDNVLVAHFDMQLWYFLDCGESQRIGKEALLCSSHFIRGVHHCSEVRGCWRAIFGNDNNFFRYLTIYSTN